MDGRTPPHAQMHLQNEQQAAAFFSTGPSQFGRELGRGDAAADTASDGQLVRAALEPTQVCSFYMRTGTCAYGNRCKFYHPHPSEVPPPVLNSRGYPMRVNEHDCAHYRKKGWCAFGMTCKFNHPELLTSPANIMGNAPPGNMLVASDGGNATLMQGPVMYSTSGGGQAYQTMVRASQTMQPAPTVYYVPTASGTFAPAVMQPYTMASNLASDRANAPGTSYMISPGPSDGQLSQLYASSTTPSNRTLYTTSSGQPLYTGTQFVESQMMGQAGMFGNQSGRPGQGSLVGQQQQGGSQNLRLASGMEVGGVTYLSEMPDQQQQQLPTAYIQQLPGLQQLPSPGQYMQQQPMQQERGGTRQHMTVAALRQQQAKAMQQQQQAMQQQQVMQGHGLGSHHASMMASTGGESSSFQHAEGNTMYDQTAGGGASGSLMQNVMGGGGGQGSGQQQSNAQELSSWQGGGNPAGQDRLVQAMQSLRLNQQK